MALHHAEPGEKLHLQSIDGANAKTAALVKTDSFEAAQLVVRAGASIHRHAVDGYVILYCVEGSVILETHGETRLSTGDWIYLARGEEHGLRAVEDSSLLLTVLFDR
jgi:quercetin dioxygenase-like cupin family protein